MRIVIMGCGRVGAALATELDERGHEVSIIDREVSAFRRLGSRYSGSTVVGMGFDRDVLEQSGLGTADSFAAVSSGDNSNIIAARVARESFGVERVIARIYDARRAEVYQRLGIQTIATVPWATTRFVSYLTGDTGPGVWSDPTGSVVLRAVTPDERWVGRRVATIEAHTHTKVVCITRFGGCSIANAEMLIQAEDVLHVVSPLDHSNTLDSLLERGPVDDNA